MAGVGLEWIMRAKHGGVEAGGGDGSETGLISGQASPRTKGIKSRATTTFVRWASRNSKSC